jgi:HAD superfamily hydrolase (TIGR01450 family)
MLKTLFPEIKAVLLDMDGVLWQDNTPLVDLPFVFARFEELGLEVRLLTNNQMKTPEQFSEKLAGFNVNFPPDKIINSAMGVVFLLKKQFPKPGPVYIIGENGTFTALKDEGYYFSETNPIAVVVGFDRNITFEKFVKATKFIRSGVPFFGTNPDFTFPTPDGLIPGSGSFIAFVQASTSQEPIIAGKPSPYLFDMCFDELGFSPQQTIGIGDRLETDILGAQRAGCRTGLVLSGVATIEDAMRWSPQPDLIARDLLEMIG